MLLALCSYQGCVPGQAGRSAPGTDGRIIRDPRLLLFFTIHCYPFLVFLFTAHLFGELKAASAHPLVAELFLTTFRHPLFMPANTKLLNAIQY